MNQTYGRRSGSLALKPHTLLEDLSRLPRAVRKELEERIVPLLDGARHLPKTRNHLLARALLEGPGPDFVDDEYHEDFLEAYEEQGVSQETLKAVIRLRSGRRRDAAALSDPDVGGGGDWVQRNGEWLYEPLEWHGATELRPFGRTLSAYIDLTPGDSSTCVPPEYGHDQLEAEEGIASLCKALARRIRAKIGGKTYLAKDFEGGCLTVLATTVGAFLVAPALQRKRNGQTVIRGDLYSQLLDNVVPDQFRELTRRLLEKGHPQHIPREVMWPLLGGKTEKGPLHVLEVKGSMLVLRPGLDKLLRGQSLREAREQDREPPSIHDTSSRSSNRSNYVKGSEDDLLNRRLLEGIATFEAMYEPPPAETAKVHHSPSDFTAVDDLERRATDPDLPTIRSRLTAEMLQEAFHESLQPSQFGIIYREIQQNRWAGYWRAKNVAQLASDATRGWDQPHNKSVFNKYKDAASKLEQFYPHLYARFLAAVVSGDPLPALPAASRLIALKKATRGLREDAKAEIARQVLTFAGSSKQLVALQEFGRYGLMPEELAGDIKAIEQLVDALPTYLEKLQRLRDFIHIRALATEIERRLGSLAGHLDALGKAVGDLQQDLAETAELEGS